MTRDKTRIALTASQIRKAKKTPGLLYLLVRAKLGLTQVDMAALLGVSKWAIVNRERCKRVYTAKELVDLQLASGLSDAEWCELLREVAK